MMEQHEEDMEMDDDEIDNVLLLQVGVVQPMLLFKLDVQKNGVSPPSNVHTMIEEHNNSKIPNETERYKLDYRDGDGMVEVFKQSKSKERSTSLYHCTTNSEHEMTNFISVYYTVDGNVYVQTTGNAWHVVTKYGDIDFPVKVSQRLLDDNGMKSQTRIPLSGNKVFQQKRCKKPERSYESTTQNVRVRFEADLRANASIRHPDLNCFVKPEKKIMVKVGVRN